MITLAVLAAATWVALVPARRGTSLLLILETITVTLILIISVLVLVKLFTHSAPAHQRFTFTIFAPTKATGTSALFLGAVFGFLSFADFEAAATSGGEARNPRRDIPRAIIGTVIIGGIFYTLTSAVEVLGFGTSASGLTAFHASGSLFGTLGSQYVASWLGDVVTVGTIVSAYGGALASIVGGSRLWYSLTSAAVERPTSVTRISTRWGTPVGAILGAGIVSAVVTVLFAWVIRFAVLNTFAWLGTVATLLIYIMVTLRAARLLFFSGQRTVNRWEIVIPAAGVIVLGYTIYRNIVLYPTGPFFWLPIASLAWIVVALAAVIASPQLSRRIAAALASDVDLAHREDETSGS